MVLPGPPQIAQMVVCLQWKRPVFNPWVRKIPRRRKWQPALVRLPGKSHGWRSLVGYSTRGHKESDMTESLPPPGPDGLLCVDYVPLRSAPRQALVLTFSISTITRPDYLHQGLGSDQKVILVCCEGSVDSFLSWDKSTVIGISSLIWVHYFEDLISYGKDLRCLSQEGLCPGQGSLSALW